MTEDRRPVFVIGDVHGHIDRLQALLEKAKVDEKDCVTVQLGDLGHFGRDTKGGDAEAWLRAKEGWLDFVLWGNHDRAVVDPRHHFGGYSPPGPEIRHLMKSMEKDGRLLMAYEAHGWLITHAGLHKQFKHQPIPPEDVDKENARSIADWLNRRMREDTLEAVIDAIGRMRGGWSPYGGILWRDIHEKLWNKVPQIFGHSAASQHIVRGEEDKWYCIDIGGRGGSRDRDADCLAGIWLPSQEIVRVDMHKGSEDNDEIL